MESGLPPRRLSWALKGSGAPFTHGICPAVLAESEKGERGEATLLVVNGEHEGDSPRSLCPMAPEPGSNPGYLAPSLAVWSEICGLSSLPGTKTCNSPLPNPSIFEEPRDPNQEAA